MWQRVAGSLSLLVLAATTSCAKRVQPPLQTFEVRVHDYAGAPIDGASLLAGTRVVARTSATGLASLSFTGREGDLLAIDVRCPAGYAPPAEPLLIQWLAVDGGGVASHLARCRKLRHRLLVAVRAEGGPNLPILRLGRTVGTTDASGAATLMFDLDVDERVELTLSTESLAKEKVTPRDPTAVLDVQDADAVKLFDIKLTRPKAPARKALGRRQGPRPM